MHVSRLIALIALLVNMLVPQYASAESGSPGELPVESAGIREWSASDAKKSAKKAVDAVDAAEDKVRKLLESAQDKRDVVRVLALADKNNQIGLALGTIRDRHASFLAALTRGNEARAQHEYRLMMVVLERVSMLLAEVDKITADSEGDMFTSTNVNVDIELNPVPLPPGGGGGGTGLVFPQPGQSASPH